jgi:hypothetical protein
MPDYFEVPNCCHSSTIKELAVICAAHFFQELPVNTPSCANSADIEQDRAAKIPVLRRCQHFDRFFIARYDPTIFYINAEHTPMIS